MYILRNATGIVGIVGGVIYSVADKRLLGRMPCFMRHRRISFARSNNRQHADINCVHLILPLPRSAMAQATKIELPALA